MSFTEGERLPSGHSVHKAQIVVSVAVMVVLLEVSPISTQDLWSSASDHKVLGHLSYPRPFSPDCSVWPAGQL